MYRLFSRISKGLDPIADCFKEHVESEGMKLVKQVAEAVEAKKEKDAGGWSVMFLSSLCVFGGWAGLS
jgi:cullin 1